MSRTPADMIRGVNAIASLPAIYMRINEAVNDPRSSVADIGKIITDDVGLTARLLQLVNSAFFGFPSKITSVSHASVIVGTQQLRSLALATSVVSVFKNVPKELIDMNSFWMHSVGCAMAARTLARQRGESDVERFFVAGLLHDVGRLVYLLKAGESAKAVFARAAEEHCLAHTAESRELGFHHGAIGSELLKTWKLPPALTEPVHYHHSPFLSMVYPMESALIHVADIVVHGLGLGNSGNPYVPPLEKAAWDRLGLEVEQLREATDEIQDQFGEIMQIIAGT